MVVKVRCKQCDRARRYFYLPPHRAQVTTGSHLHKADAFLRHHIKPPLLGQLSASHCVLSAYLPKLYHREQHLLLAGVGNTRKFFSTVSVLVLSASAPFSAS